MHIQRSGILRFTAAAVFMVFTAQLAGGQTSNFQGSVAVGSATAETLSLTLDDAIQRGLRNNLGALLSQSQANLARGQRLDQLQPLLPRIEGNIQEAVLQTDLAAQGLRIPHFPTVIGPYGYTDLRANLTASLVDLSALRNYLSARHNFTAAQLSAEDAREMVVLAVGNAYLLVLADEAHVESVEAELETAQHSLEQAIASHQAGTAPLLDELRARVDAQSEEQQRIAARNALEKDKLALARTMGLPLAQNYVLADKVPFAAMDPIDLESALKRAHQNRKDLAALAEQIKASEERHKAAVYDRLPTLKANADYGDIGVNVSHSHGTGNAVGTLSIPLFNEAEFRGESQVTQSQLDTLRARLSDQSAQVDADVREALLDITATQKLVQVAHSNADLAREVLSEAQQRYASGVSDNLAVTQALGSVAQANNQYVTSLYQHNMAKLNLARALGEAQGYKTYLGGK